MEDNVLLKDSEKRINKIKIMHHFFDHHLVVAISVRSRVIHDVFASNPSLDKNKLELFHLQYTDSFLELLKKLKKKNEQNYLIINNEIIINQEMIQEYQKEIEKDVFCDRVKTHNLIMQAFMKLLYQHLAYENSISVLTNLKEKNDLSDELGLEYYRKISDESYNKFLNYPRNASYTFLNFEIEKKLIGKLNLQHFKFKLCCGFQYNSYFIEVYEFIHCNEYFVYIKEKNQYFFIEISDFKELDFSRNKSNKKEIILQLKQKNEQMQRKAKLQLNMVPNDVENVLKDYLDKISMVEFLDDLKDIDEETNILKTMLNLNIK